MPTSIQAMKSVILCQYLSSGYKPINVFRYDLKYKTIYIQAGESDGIILLIYPDGKWGFVL